MSYANHIQIENFDSSMLVTIQESRVYDEMLVNHITEQIHTVLEKNEKEKVILDFGNVAYLSSSFLGKIIGINKKTKAKSQRLVLCGINDDIMEIFQITKLEKFFTFKKNREEALAVS